jgi:hypothetical protein
VKASKGHLNKEIKKGTKSVGRRSLSVGSSGITAFWPVLLRACRALVEETGNKLIPGFRPAGLRSERRAGGGG